MKITNINKNAITSSGQSYSNYIYTFTLSQSNNESDTLCLLSYQIETNKAFQEYLDGTENIIERFRYALKLEENQITIMNMCVIYLAQRTLDDIVDLALKAKNHSKEGETHHVVLLVEYYLLIHDDYNSLKYLIELFINQEQQDVVVQALSKEVFSCKLYTIEHLTKFVQDSCILKELIKINKLCFIQQHSQVSSNSFYTKKSQNLNQDFMKILKQQSESQDIYIKEQLSKQINTHSYQTQETDQLSFISQTYDININTDNCSLLDFCFIDIVLDNPNLFSFQYRLPYMIGSYNIKEMNKLQAKIAEGGFGEVYVAKHLKTNEIHALKIIKQQEDQNVNLIFQEIIIQDKIQKLNSQLFINLKPLIYLTKHSKLVDIYIPLELAQFSLYEYIQEHKIDEQEYNQFYNLFIDYIVTLHSNKYAHRDIKPQNILYVKDVGWKLADFGESIKYEDVEDIYKIRGTIAFLPFRIRRQSKQFKQIKQNLLQNDLYAVVCTLIMIKNPKFNSQDLIYHMNNTQLDQQLQQLLQNIDNIDILEKLKIPQLQQIETKIIIKKYIQDQECQWDCYEKLRFYTEQQQQLDNDFKQQLDKLLEFYKEKQQYHNLVSLSLLIYKSFPFQIDKFKNIIQFIHQRHLLAYLQTINVTKYSYYQTIIEYFLIIKLYDLAISICDQIMNLKYTLIFHLLKIHAFICLDQLKQAKEELELIYRYFISTQSYSLQEQLLFFNLYFKLHKQLPQIKVDKMYKNSLIQSQKSIKSNYHVTQGEWQDSTNKKEHLQLRLDVLFEFVYQDPFQINKKICEETVKNFGSQFLVDGQLVNCEEFIQLIKENLNFWSNKYITKIHIIAIGLNYLFNYYGKYQIALDIGQYFHNTLRNIGSCEALLDHYEHLLNTQFIVYQQFDQKPATFIDLHRCLEEVQQLSLFDQIYVNLKAMTIWHVIDIKFQQFQSSQEQNEQFKQQIRYLLDQLNIYLNKNGSYSNQREKLISFLNYMMINFMNSQLFQIVNQFQIVRKIFRVLQDMNYGQKTFITDFNKALLMTKQYKLNLILLKQYMDNNVIVIQPLSLQEFMYQNLINIYLSPIKVSNILNMQGLDKNYSLVFSIEQNFDSDLKIILSQDKNFKKAKSRQVLKQKIHQISLKQNYLNL